MGTAGLVGGGLRAHVAPVRPVSDLTGHDDGQHGGDGGRRDTGEGPALGSLGRCGFARGRLVVGVRLGTAGDAAASGGAPVFGAPVGDGGVRVGGPGRTGDTAAGADREDVVVRAEGVQVVLPRPSAGACRCLGKAEAGPEGEGGAKDSGAPLRGPDTDPYPAPGRPAGSPQPPPGSRCSG